MTANWVVCSAGIARFSAYEMGTVPTRISMIRPMPFWPSLEPCENDTPVQVRISSARIHGGGGVLPLGASYSALFFTKVRSASSSSAAKTKPTSGDSSSE